MDNNDDKFKGIMLVTCYELLYHYSGTWPAVKSGTKKPKAIASFVQLHPHWIFGIGVVTPLVLVHLQL